MLSRQFQLRRIQRWYSWSVVPSLVMINKSIWGFSPAREKTICFLGRLNLDWSPNPEIMFLCVRHDKYTQILWLVVNTGYLPNLAHLEGDGGGWQDLTRSPTRSQDLQMVANMVCKYTHGTWPSCEYISKTSIPPNSHTLKIYIFKIWPLIKTWQIYFD